ncbi:MAG: hypothetical protein R3F14_29770 [Polyangiaceae bacterium]
MLVEVAGGDAAGRAEHGDAVLGEVAADRVAGEGAGALEAALVESLGVGDIDFAGDGVDRHVVEDGADSGVRAADLDWHAGVRVDGEHVVVGEVEGDLVGPGSAVLVAPLLAVVAEDEAGGGVRDTLEVGGGAGEEAAAEIDGGKEAVVEGGLVQDGGLVAGVEGGGVDPGAVGADGEGAGGVGEEGEHGEGRCALRRGVQNPHVGAADSGGGELRIDRAVLPAVGGGDEGAVLPGAGKHDVARLVADEEGAGNSGGVAVLTDLHHTDAVRQVIDHPYLVVPAGGDGDGLDTDSHRRAVLQTGGGDPEDLHPVVRSVHRIKELAVLGEGERPDLAALESCEGCVRRCFCREAQGGEDGERWEDGLEPAALGRDMGIVRHGFPRVGLGRAGLKRRRFTAAGRPGREKSKTGTWSSCDRRAASRMFA